MSGYTGSHMDVLFCKLIDELIKFKFEIKDNKSLLSKFNKLIPFEDNQYYAIETENEIICITSDNFFHELFYDCLLDKNKKVNIIKISKTQYEKLPDEDKEIKEFLKNNKRIPLKEFWKLLKII